MIKILGVKIVWFFLSDGCCGDVVSFSAVT